jgi:hypothetical protein
MVGTARFELATPCTPSKCATRLRYVPMESAAQIYDGSVEFDFQILHQSAAPGEDACSYIEEATLCHKRRVMTVTFRLALLAAT